MARDGNGTMSIPYPDFVSGTAISSTQVDANNSDITTALTQSIAVDGQSTITADLPMDGNKHTAVDAASGMSSRTEYVSTAVLQDGDLTELGSVAGTGDVITAATTPAISSYAKGQRFSLVVGSTNTGAVTINISAVGAKAVQKLGAALVAGDMTAGDVALIEYDGTQFQMLSPARTMVMAAGSVDTAELATDAVTTGKITDGNVTTAKIADNAVDATKLKDALIGDFTEVTVAAGDSILFGDADDSGNTKRDTVQGILDLAGFPAADFTSTEQTVSTGATLNVAHSLAAVPTLVQVVLRCKTTDLGYAVGDEIPMYSSGTLDGADGVVIGSNSTNVFIRVGSNIELLNGSFSNANITTGSWRWVVRAWA